MNGAGKYDDLCTQVREAAEAQAVVLVVMDGNKGSGFSVQSHEPMSPAVLSVMLADLAHQVRQSDTMSTHQKTAYALLSIGKAAGALSHEDVRQEVIDSLKRGDLSPHYLAQLRNRLDELLQAARVMEAPPHAQ